MTSGRERVVAAAVAVAHEEGLTVRDARVLHESNKVIVHLSPCDVVARIAAEPFDGAEFEVGIARQLADVGAPVVPALPREAPRIHRRDGHVITLWEYRRPQGTAQIAPGQYAAALHRLHEGMRGIRAEAPRASDRVDAALRLLADPDRTPDLPAEGRELLTGTLDALRPAVARWDGAQLLHGEPHPGNVVPTETGPELLDFETCCRGPVEFDLAHAPQAVAEHYPGANLALVRDLRRLVLAMVTTWRFDREDEFPDGRRLGLAWLADLREGRDPFAP